MNHTLSISKGLSLRLAGAVDPSAGVVTVTPHEVAVIPDDFHGFLPKIEVKEGENVVAGQPLMYDKRDADIKLVSPVDGIVSAVVRGERRKLERVVITPATTTADKKSFTAPTSPDDVRLFLKQAGLWVMMRQRPYDIIPDSNKTPRDIFVTAIDSAPLAVNPAKYYGKDAQVLAMAVKALASLTTGKVYVARREGELADIAGAEMVDVKGVHPAGNVGVHIANIAPVNKGETVWTMDLATLHRIGVALRDGVVPAQTFVAVTGSEITKPCVVSTVAGCDMKSLLAGRIAAGDKHRRIISGNVLTGVKVTDDGYLHFPYAQVTVIPEGDDVDEFMGWASLSPSHESTSRSFPGHFLWKKLFRPDARLHGGRRALIMSGEYERYMPMDILPEYLLKAIIGRDIEKMEQLGIYEVAPEDFALGEYADTSKLEAQKIVREGLDYLRKELE